MRNTLLVLVALLGTTAAAAGQTPEWANKLFAKGGTTHNFGNVPRGAILSHRFTMTNIYAVPLEIIGTRVSCGCVTVKPAVSVLQPRESTTVEVTMDGRRFIGPKNVKIFISVGPQYTSTATLEVSANSRADIVFNPGQVNFGVVASGQTPTQIIEVEYAGQLDWRVKGLVEHNLPLDVEIKELYRRPGPINQVGYRLTIAVKATAPAGSHRWELLLQTNDNASPTVPMLIEATVQAALSVVPHPLHLSGVTVGQEVTKKVLVRGSKPFRILGVDGQGDGLTVDVPAAAAAIQVVTVKWQPAQAGNIRRELRFRTDLDSGATTSLVVEGKTAP
jgi:hypothetical protein